MATVTQVFDTERRRHEEYTKQAQLSITAWSEVSIQTLKADLTAQLTDQNQRVDEYCQEQIQRVNAYCTDQTTALDMLLDGYAEHARGTQAQLLVRLRKDTLETYAALERTHNRAAAQTVPIDDEVATTPSNPSAAMPPTTRWKHVNVEEIQRTAQAATEKDHTIHRDTDPPHRSTFESASKPSWQSPTQQAKYSDPEYQISRLRATQTPSHLRGRDRKNVTTF